MKYKVKGSAMKCAIVKTANEMQCSSEQTRLFTIVNYIESNEIYELTEDELIRFGL